MELTRHGCGLGKDSQRSGPDLLGPRVLGTLRDLVRLPSTVCRSGVHQWAWRNDTSGPRWVAPDRVRRRPLLRRRLACHRGRRHAQTALNNRLSGPTLSRRRRGLDLSPAPTGQDTGQDYDGYYDHGQADNQDDSLVNR